MKGIQYARVLAEDRARKTGKPYVVYQVRNGQWMVDPYEVGRIYSGNQEIFNPPVVTLHESDKRNEQIVHESVESSSLFMNKHHAALDTINEALVHLVNGRVQEAKTALECFQVEYDSTEEEG